MNYTVNDFMIVATIFWFIYSMTYLDKIFEYNSNASYWIIKLLGNNINLSFFIRCLFEERALETVFSIFVIVVLAFSFIIRIFEFENPFNNFQNLYNSIWFSFITMVTVGYGDYLPISVFGRFFSFFLGVVGVMNLYLITVILSDKLSLWINEEAVLWKYQETIT